MRRALRPLARPLLVCTLAVSILPASFAQGRPGDVPELPPAGKGGESPKVVTPGGSTLTFSESKIAVGFARTQDTHLEMSLEIRMARPGMEARALNMHSLRREEVTEKALALDAAGAVSRVQVRFGRAEEVDTHNGQRRSKTFPNSNKTYIVERAADGALKVTYPEGGTPSPRELREALSEARLLKKRDSLTDALMGRTVRVGENAPYLRQGVLAAFARGKKARGMNVQRLTTTVKDIRPCGKASCAVFTIEMDLSMGTAGGMTMELRGDLLVRGEGAWPLFLELKGPLLVRAGNSQGQNDPGGQAEKPQVSGGGDILIRFRNQFE